MVHGNHVHVSSSPVSLTFSVESPQPLTGVPWDCCCRLAGSRYAIHVGCLPQPFPVGESDLCKHRSGSTPPITAFHSQDMDCKIEWSGPRCWCNLSGYCVLIGVCTQATLASSSLLRRPVLCPSPPCLPSSLYSAHLVHSLPPTVLPLSMCSLNSIAALRPLWLPGCCLSHHPYCTLQKDSTEEQMHNLRVEREFLNRSSIPQAIKENINKFYYIKIGNVLKDTTLSKRHTTKKDIFAIQGLVSTVYEQNTN